MTKKKAIAVGIHLSKYTREDYERFLEEKLGRRMIDLQPKYTGGEMGTYLAYDDEGHAWELRIQDGVLDIQRVTGYDRRQSID